jgi:hypothetical protein
MCTSQLHIRSKQWKSSKWSPPQQAWLNTYPDFNLIPPLSCWVCFRRYILGRTAPLQCTYLCMLRGCRQYLWGTVTPWNSLWDWCVGWKLLEIQKSTHIGYQHPAHLTNGNISIDFTLILLELPSVIFQPKMFNTKPSKPRAYTVYLVITLVTSSVHLSEAQSSLLPSNGAWPQCAQFIDINYNGPAGTMCKLEIGPNPC